MKFKPEILSFFNFFFRNGFLVQFYPIPELDTYKYEPDQKNLNLYLNFLNLPHCGLVMVSTNRFFITIRLLLYFENVPINIVTCHFWSLSPVTKIVTMPITRYYQACVTDNNGNGRCNGIFSVKILM